MTGLIPVAPFAPPPPMGTDHDFTVREYQVLVLLAERVTTKEIAERLKLSVNTVNTYVHHLYIRLGVSSRLELGSWIARNGPILPA